MSAEVSRPGRTVRTRITDTAIRRHAENDDVFELTDNRHSTLRFRYHQRRSTGSWYLVTHRGGDTRWHKLGRWPDLPAQRILRELPAVMGNLAVAPDSRELLNALDTMDDLLTWYLERSQMAGQLSNRRRSAIQSVVEKHLRPRIGELSIEGLQKNDLDKNLVLPLLQTGYQASTIRSVYSVLKAATKQATLMQLIRTDPLAGMRFTDFISTRIPSKPGALRPGDVPEVLQQIRQADTGPRLMCLLMLWYGTRIGETRQAITREFDLQNRWWYIPASHTKTGRALKLPITQPVALELSRYLSRHTATALFSKRQGGAISATTANEWVQSVSRRQWTAHDLRKLARTCWADHGVDWMVSEMMLNHTLPGISQTYIHTHVEQVMRRSLDEYHSWLKQGAIPSDRTDSNRLTGHTSTR